MSYVRKNIYIVKSRDGDILRVFGVREEAEKSANAIPRAVVDVWPVEFKVEEMK